MSMRKVRALSFFRNEGVYYVKRIIYVCSFCLLCIIDQIIGSATGAIQYGVKNYTAVIIGIVILTSFKLKDFIKVPYFIWIIFHFFFKNYIMKFANGGFYNISAVNTNFWLIGIYGIVLIRLFYQVRIEKKVPQVYFIKLFLGIILIVFMMFIRYDWEWPKVLCISMICLWTTNFRERDLNNLYISMLDGIILGYFIIQIQAWLFRPYDTLRYLGMYSHPNMNALMHVCAYCAVLGRWYWEKINKRSVFACILLIILSGLILDTMFFTSSRSALITVIVVTVVYLVFQMCAFKKKILELIVNIIALVTAVCVCFFPAYWMIRYIPAYVDNPIYFEGDIVEEKIQKGDTIDSLKYYEIEEALDGNIVRYLWFMNVEDAEAFESNIIRWFEKILNPMQVQAIENVEEYCELTDEVYIEPGTDSKHPLLKNDEEYNSIKVRLEIYEYFMNKLELIGKTNKSQGVWLHWNFQATHCHNIFLQMAYDFGIIVGSIFIIVTFMLFMRIYRGLFENKSPMWYFRLFISAGFATIEVVFGMTEMAYIYGQLPLTMFWFVQYIIYHKQPHEIEAEQATGGEEDTYVLNTPSGVVVEDGLEIIDMDED